MLSLFPPPTDGAKTVWLDLQVGSDEERAKVEAIFGSPLPSRESLSEIENSSRMRSRDGVLFMSIPSAAPRSTGEGVSPIGFMLSAEQLVTMRYTPLKSFDAVAAKFAGGEGPASGLDAFVTICEEIVDRIADSLEYLAGELAPLSRAAFHVDDVEGHKAVRSNKLLRVQLRSLGRHGDRLSEIRDALVGLGRITVYACHNTQDWSDEAIKQRLDSLTEDIASLNDYDAQMFNKIQFLLDALVGLISIAQNDIFKVLTIVSIVGIPPTLVAGVYGMNFHNMPEYTWRYGYQFGLALIVLSAVVPLIWFRIKGWF